MARRLLFYWSRHPTFLCRVISTGSCSRQHSTTVTFLLVKTPNPYVPHHLDRFVLAARSAFFAAALRSRMAEHTASAVVLRAWSPPPTAAAMRALLWFIYTGTFDGDADADEAADDREADDAPPTERGAAARLGRRRSAAAAATVPLMPRPDGALGPAEALDVLRLIGGDEEELARTLATPFKLAAPTPPASPPPRAAPFAHHCSGGVLAPAGGAGGEFDRGLGGGFLQLRDNVRLHVAVRRRLALAPPYPSAAAGTGGDGQGSADWPRREGRARGGGGDRHGAARDAFALLRRASALVDAGGGDPESDRASTAGCARAAALRFIVTHGGDVARFGLSGAGEFEDWFAPTAPFHGQQRLCRGDEDGDHDNDAAGDGDGDWWDAEQESAMLRDLVRALLARMQEGSLVAEGGSGDMAAHKDQQPPG